jgi:hypothetical protein
MDEKWLLLIGITCVVVALISGNLYFFDNRKKKKLRALQSVVTQWEKTGAIDFRGSVPLDESKLKDPLPMFLAVQESRIIKSYFGVEHMEFRYRHASPEEAIEVMKVVREAKVSHAQV